MDTYYEQIIERRKTGSEKVIMGVTVALGVIGIIILLYTAFVTISSPFTIVFFLLACAFGYSILWFISRSHVEFEYSLTNNCLDIDRIIAKSKRERLIEVDCTEFTEFGEYDKNAERLGNLNFDTIVHACNRHGDAICYFVIKHQKFGNTLVLIQPNEQIKTALDTFSAKPSAVLRRNQF